jgi:hypothetical protein
MTVAGDLAATGVAPIGPGADRGVISGTRDGAGVRKHVRAPQRRRSVRYISSGVPCIADRPNRPSAPSPERDERRGDAASRDDHGKGSRRDLQRRHLQWPPFDPPVPLAPPRTTSQWRVQHVTASVHGVPMSEQAAASAASGAVDASPPSTPPDGVSVLVQPIELATTWRRRAPVTAIMSCFLRCIRFTFRNARKRQLRLHRSRSPR